MSLLTELPIASLNLTLESRDVARDGDLVTMHEVYLKAGKPAFERIVQYSPSHDFLPVSVKLVRAGVQANGTWRFDWKRKPDHPVSSLTVGDHYLAAAEAETVIILDPSQPGIPNRHVRYEIRQLDIGVPGDDDPVVRAGNLKHLDAPEGYFYSDYRDAT